MPITVLCPGCKSKLTAPPAAAGKKVKCPKCQGVLQVPAAEPADDFEVVEEDDFEVVEDAPAKPTLAATRSPRSGARDDDEPPRKKWRIVEDEDDEDEDDDYDRPRKKGKKKPPAKSMLPIYLGGGVLVLILLGVGVYMLFSGGAKKEKAGAGGADSWVRFTAPDGSFNISFPATPSTMVDSALDELMGVSPEKAAKMHADEKKAGNSPENWTATEGNRRYVISMRKLPFSIPDDPQNQQMMQADARKEFETYGKILGEESIDVAGKKSPSLRLKTANGKNCLITMLILGDRIYGFTILDDDDVTSSDANAKKFFDSFRSGRAIAADPSKAGPKGKRR